MCGDCYDYTAAVLFNARAGKLWRRFTTYLPRHLGITVKRLRTLVRVRYVKVAEYQARGVVHFHAVIRLDAPGEDYQRPPPGIDAAILCDAVRAATAAVRIIQDDGTGTGITLGFGAPQGTDVRPIRRDDLAATGKPLNHQAVGNYIAKYATKTLTVPGLSAQQLHHQSDIEHLRCPAHQKRMITTAWQLGSRRCTGQARFRKWAHMLGYGGHFLTKSRRYSVTFDQLRKARTNYRVPNTILAVNATPGAVPWTRLSSWSSAPGPTPELATPPPPDAQLALASAARAREHGRHAAMTSGRQPKGER